MSDPDPHPTPVPSPAAPPALRASDADREQVIEILRGAAGEGRLDADELEQRVAVAYAARTFAELTPLTADLVASTPPPPPATPAGDDHTMIISILGGNDRRGRWRVARRVSVLNIMGGSELDLSQAELSGPRTEISVLSIMGGSELRVPRGVEVHVTKIGIMGGHDVQLDDEPAPAGAPVIRIKLLAIMGGGKVRQGPPPRRDQRAVGRGRPRD